MLARLVFYLAFSLLVLGCSGDKEDTSLERGAGSLSQIIEKTKRAFSELSSDEVESIAKSEADKLFSVEYRVFQTKRDSGDMGDEELGAILNEEGKEGWDCFHVENTGGGYRFFCKSKPKSYLRYIARQF